jgi:hypothetical protein
MQKRDWLINKEKEAKLNYTRYILRALVGTAEKSLDVSCALREELGYPLTSADRKAKLHKFDVMRKSVEAFLERIDEKTNGTDVELPNDICPPYTIQQPHDSTGLGA